MLFGMRINVNRFISDNSKPLAQIPLECAAAYELTKEKARMSNNISSVDYFIIINYLVGTTVFGSWFVKRSGDMDHFNLAGKMIPGRAIGVSLMATT